MTIHSKTQEITRCGQYWAFAHYSKLMQRGARVLSSRGDLPYVSHVAVENPDGGYVLVLTNQSGLERLVPCSVGAYELQVRLPRTRWLPCFGEFRRAPHRALQINVHAERTV